MIHGSLFSGIGGFDLAASWMGWTNAFNCEINEFCSRILKYHFPDAEHYADITRTDFTSWRGRIDVLSGGRICLLIHGTPCWLPYADYKVMEEGR